MTYMNTEDLGFMKDIGAAINFTMKAGHVAASMILTYAAIDCMASLVMPEDQKEVKRGDFIGWVNKYMKADPSQPYQYAGIDLYGARCGLVHRYSSSSRQSDKGKCKIFQYLDAGNHKYDPGIDKNVVCISAPRLVHDFYAGMMSFLSDLERDASLKTRVQGRIGSIFHLAALKK